MTQTTFKQKTSLIIISSIAAILLVEITLRATGVFIMSVQNYKNQKALYNQNTIRILCIGESTTFMDDENSYPSQLERMLNRSDINKNFKVINKGVPGIRSSYIARNIKNWLDAFDPDIVVAMMGINDPFVLAPVEKESAAQQLKTFLKNIRVLQLAKWLKTSYLNKPAIKRNKVIKKILPENNEDKKINKITEKSGEGKSELRRFGILYIISQKMIAAKEYDKAERILRMFAEDNTYAIWHRLLYRDIARLLMEQKKYKKLAEVIQNNLTPGDSRIRDWLPYLCKDKISAPHMLRVLKKWIEKEPDSVSFNKILGGCLEDSGDLEQAKIYYKKSRQLLSDKVNSVTKTHYLQISKVLGERDIKGVFVQYPLRDIENLKVIFREEKNFNKYLFVNNEKHFKEALLKGKYEDYFTDRFAGDLGHCTPEGNRIIAQNIADTILKNIFFK